MQITWEDRKLSGSIDNSYLSSKPMFSFNYAWFLVTETTAQYAVSHDEGVYNEDMSKEQKDEVTSFYRNYRREPLNYPSHDKFTQKIVENGIEFIDGLAYKTFEVVPLSELELSEMRKLLVPQSITKLQAMRAMKQTDINTTTNTSMWNMFQALLASNVDANDEWMLALDLQRNHPLVIALTPALGKTDAQIDELFTLAGTL